VPALESRSWQRRRRVADEAGPASGPTWRSRSSEGKLSRRGELARAVTSARNVGGENLGLGDRDATPCRGGVGDVTSRRSASRRERRCYRRGETPLVRRAISASACRYRCRMQAEGAEPDVATRAGSSCAAIRTRPRVRPAVWGRASTPIGTGQLAKSRCPGRSSHEEAAVRCALRGTRRRCYGDAIRRSPPGRPLVRQYNFIGAGHPHIDVGWSRTHGSGAPEGRTAPQGVKRFCVNTMDAGDPTHLPLFRAFVRTPPADRATETPEIAMASAGIFHEDELILERSSAPSERTRDRTFYKSPTSTQARGPAMWRGV